MRVFILLTLTFLNAGCSTKCDKFGIVGSYMLHTDVDQYDLRLDSDDSGELLRNQRKLGALTWEIEPETGQVFLRASRNVLDVLQEFSDVGTRPIDVPELQSGYFGISPVCGSNGIVTRLDLDVDGQRFFSRQTK